MDKCYECADGYYEGRHGTLRFDGYIVHDVEYYRCDRCGGLLFPVATCRAIEGLRGDEWDIDMFPYRKLLRVI